MNISAIMAITRAELIMMMRNRTVAFTAVLFPLLLAAFFGWKRDNLGHLGSVVLLQVVTIAALGVYLTATSTLAARRSNNFLKKLRTTTASPSTILAGMLLPIVAINLVQIIIVLGVLAILGDAPSNPLGLALGVVGFEAFFLVAGVATAAVTTSPEHAQITTLPMFIGTIGVSMWMIFTGVEQHNMIKRLLPGGAPAELILTAWPSAGHPDSSVLGAGWAGFDAETMVRLVGASVVWVCVALIMSRRMFTWEVRR